MTTTKPETAEKYLARFRKLLPTVTLLDCVSRREFEQALAHIETLIVENAKLRAERDGAIEELKHLWEDDLGNLSNEWAERIRQRLKAREEA